MRRLALAKEGSKTPQAIFVSSERLSSRRSVWSKSDYYRIVARKFLIQRFSVLLRTDQWILTYDVEPAKKSESEWMSSM